MDEEAIRAFVHDDYSRLVAALTAVAGARTEAEDAVQEALARAWERGEAGDVIRSPAAWIATVALNHLRSGLRRRFAERRAHDRTLERATEQEDDRPSQRLYEALGALPRRQREAIVLRYFLGFSGREIASVQHTFEGTVRVTLYRARAKLARLLRLEEDD